MPRARRIAQNVLSNWLALGVTTVAGFFLSPYVVHHSGNLTYGVWVIIGSLVSYMGLLDLGLRGAVTRFVSKGVAQNDHEQSGQGGLRSVVDTALDQSGHRRRWLIAVGRASSRLCYSTRLAAGSPHRGPGDCDHGWYQSLVWSFRRSVGGSASL